MAHRWESGRDPDLVFHTAVCARCDRDSCITNYSTGVVQALERQTGTAASTFPYSRETHVHLILLNPSCFRCQSMIVFRSSRPACIGIFHNRHTPRLGQRVCVRSFFFFLLAHPSTLLPPNPPPSSTTHQSSHRVQPQQPNDRSNNNRNNKTHRVLLSLEPPITR